MAPFPPSPQRKPRAQQASLAERVEYHVAQTALQLDRARRARRPLAGRSRRSPAAVGDLQQASLRVVFREFGDAHRAYRSRTGQAGTPALRAAAYAFKRTPTLPTLVTVAAFLDELGLLAW